MVAVLLGLAGVIYGVLGTLHAVFTFIDERHATRLAPSDPAVTAAMRASHLRLSGGATTMWQAWISFNLTHSLAALLMAAACFITATTLGKFAFPPWALFALAGTSLLFALIGQRYWFGVPRAGTAVATGVLLLAALVYVV
jgi:hypothetical protein